MKTLEKSASASMSAAFPPSQIYLVKGRFVPISDSGTENEEIERSPKTEVNSAALAPSLQAKVLPLDWLLAEKSKSSLTDRILARLLQAEAHETDSHLRDDYRQAFLTLSLASRGNTMPFVVASYQMYGVHPDKVWSHIQADRRARLGKEYSQWYDHAGNRRPDLPKKPSTSQQAQSVEKENA